MVRLVTDKEKQNHSGARMMLSSESVKAPTRTAMFSNMAVSLEKKPFVSHVIHALVESMRFFTGDIPPKASQVSFY